MAANSRRFRPGMCALSSASARQNCVGQCGAVAGIYTAFYLSHFTEVDVRLIVLGSLSVAFAVNAAVYLILRRL